jgi:hypothetical protein
MYTFIVLLVWITPFGVPSCTKFAVAAQDQEQAIELAFVDIESTPDIVASIRLESIRLDNPTVLVQGDFTGDMCNFSGGNDGSQADD